MHSRSSTIVFVASCAMFIYVIGISIKKAEFITEKEHKNINKLEKLQKTPHSNQRTKRDIQKICYDNVGCFNNSGPFNYLEVLPSSPAEIKTKFFFYSTRFRSEDHFFELPFSDMATEFEKGIEDDNKNSSIISALYTLDSFDEILIRVIVHGFGSACPHIWIYELKSALMAVENCIVICVDWANGATFPNYVRAAANTRLVGKQLAMLLKKLIEIKKLDLTKTHIIGFSLGAHVAGFAGAELQNLSRITGLDPAGPLFESQHPDARLDDTDAKFVDVIHSNGDSLILGGLGSWQPMGHVDFYPNGGRVQTGCSNLFVGAVTDFIWSQTTDVEGRSLCNHRRAYKFFIDSVSSRCVFPAFPCDSYDNFLKGKCFSCEKKEINNISNRIMSRCGNMGFYADKSFGRGQLYLITREEEPFCANQFKIEVHNSVNDLPLRTVGKLEAILEDENGLNETFLLTEKDDTEFYAGEIIAKIIVPHPALGFPINIKIQYESYNGWITKGLRHWDIDKVILTDIHGHSHSFCSTSMPLLSGVPFRITLKPGLCNDSRMTDTNSTNNSYTHTLNNNSFYRNYSDEVDVIKNVKIKKDIHNSEYSFNFSSGPHIKNFYKNDFPENFLNKTISKSSRRLDEDFEIHNNTKNINNNSDKISVQLLNISVGQILDRDEGYILKNITPLAEKQTPQIFWSKYQKSNRSDFEISSKEKDIFPLEIPLKLNDYNKNQISITYKYKPENKTSLQIREPDKSFSSTEQILHKQNHNQPPNEKIYINLPTFTPPESFS